MFGVDTASKQFVLACVLTGILGCGNNNSTTPNPDRKEVTSNDEQVAEDSSSLQAGIKQIFQTQSFGKPDGGFLTDAIDQASENTAVSGVEAPPNQRTIRPGTEAVPGTSAQLTDAADKASLNVNQSSAALESPDVNRLMARLHELYRLQVEVQSVEQFLEIQKERIEKATQLLAAEPSYEFQILAIKSQIHALSWQDGARVPGGAEALTRRCRELLASENEEFRRMGMLGLMGAYFRALENNPQMDFAPLITDIREVVPKNANDFELATELAQAASTIFKKGQRENAVKFMQALRESLRDSQEASVIGIADSLAAQVAMAEVRFDKVIAGQLEDESANLPNLVSAMDAIIASGTTVALYNEMIPWMRRFEEYGRYRSADTVAAALENAFRRLPSDPANVEVLEAIRPIRQRMDLIGKTLEWNDLLDYKDQRFDSRLLNNKIVLLTFFTAAGDENQRNQLQFETRLFEELHNHGFTMVGFNVDNDPKAAQNFFRNRPPRWNCVRPSDPSKLGFAAPLAQQVVADQTPYRLLIDRDGRVAHVAVPIERLGVYVKAMMQDGQ